MGKKRTIYDPEDTSGPAKKEARKTLTELGAKDEPIDLIDYSDEEWVLRHPTAEGATDGHLYYDSDKEIDFQLGLDLRVKDPGALIDYSDEELYFQSGPANDSRARPAPRLGIDQQTDQITAVDDDFDYLKLYMDGENTTNGLNQTSPSETSTKITESQFLAQVLELFPNIAHDYVATLYQSKANSGVFPFDEVLDEIVDNRAYPKERDNKGKQPQRELTTEDHNQIYTRDRPVARGKLRAAILDILKSEFPNIPVKYIQGVLSQNRGQLYPSSMALVEAKHKKPQPWAGNAKCRTSCRPFSAIALEYGPHIANIAALEDELTAAKIARAKVADDMRLVIREEANISSCRAVGAISECTVCFDETPLNRAIRCNGEHAHYTCFGCAGNYIVSEVGESRCKLFCPSSCGGGFTEAQLYLVPNHKKLVDKLLALQQDQEIREAGLDDVVDCPFCDYKQVCPDVEIDSEFRCKNPDCEILSCRKCQKKSHTPYSCMEEAMENGRHKIEEAMSDALIRKCNSCKKPFIKIDGCNRMTCPNCGHSQCYICSASTPAGYAHFQPTGTCAVHDNLEVRHATDVNMAEKKARALVEAENPHINKKDLDFTVV